MAAVTHTYPSIGQTAPGALAASRRCLATFARRCPAGSRVPMPLETALATVAHLLHTGRVAMAVLAVVTVCGDLRVKEAVAVKVKDFIPPTSR